MVPVEYQDYESREAELADMIADNRISEFSTLDKDILDVLMAELSDAEFDLLLTGFDDFYKDIEAMIEDQTEVYESRHNQTGEMDLDDFHEENYDNCCPKCGFRW